MQNLFYTHTTPSDYQCDQIWRFIGLWASFSSIWQQLICPNLPHSWAMFVKVLKSFIFLVKSLLGNFSRHLDIFSGHTADYHPSGFFRDPHHSQLHKGIHFGVFKLQQKVTRPKARLIQFSTSLRWMGGSNQMPAYLGQLLHLWSHFAVSMMSVFAQERRVRISRKNKRLILKCRNLNNFTVILKLKFSPNWPNEHSACFYRYYEVWYPWLLVKESFGTYDP